MYRWIKPLAPLFARATPMAVGGAAGALVVLLFSSPSAVVGGHDPVGASRPDRPQSGAGQSRSWEGELAQLAADNAHLESQLLALQQQLQSLTAPSPVVQTTQERQVQGGQPEPQGVGAVGEGTDEQFKLLEDQFFAAPVDADWSAAMQRDLHVIEARLEASTAGNTFIGHQECRSNRCRVELVHDAPMPAQLPALIASPQNSRVTLRTVDEEGQLKTIALYQK